jgi:hypothetical protein
MLQDAPESTIGVIVVVYSGKALLTGKRDKK